MFRTGRVAHVLRQGTRLFEVAEARAYRDSIEGRPTLADTGLHFSQYNYLSVEFESQYYCEWIYFGQNSRF